MKKKERKFLIESAVWQNNALQSLLGQENEGKTVNPNGDPPPNPPNG